MKERKRGREYREEEDGGQSIERGEKWEGASRVEGGEDRGKGIDREQALNKENETTEAEPVGA